MIWITMLLTRAPFLLPSWGQFQQQFTSSFCSDLHCFLHTLNGIWCKFWLCTLVELGIFLLVKLNGTFYAKCRASVHMQLAQKCWWNRPLVSLGQSSSLVHIHEMEKYSTSVNFFLLSNGLEFGLSFCPFWTLKTTKTVLDLRWSIRREFF